jgi:hypothetical protein
LNAPSPVRRCAGVLSRGHYVLLAAALAFVSPALAQDGGGKGKGKGEEKTEESAKKKSEEETLFEAIAGEWKAGNAAALAARFPSQRKVSLRLPDAEAGEYRAEQARSLLEKYFAGRTFSKATLKSVREMTGTFEIEYARTSDRKRVKAELLLVLGTEEKRRVLVSARESP